MRKSLMAACLAIAVTAVVPTLAVAGPVLTEPTGTTVGASVKVKTKNVGSATFVTSTGTPTCTTVLETGVLLSNSKATGAVIEITSVEYGGTGPTQAGASEPECTGSNFFTPNTTFTMSQSLPWCFQAPVAADTFTVKGGKCGGAQTSINFKLDVTGIGTCEYTRAATVNGTLVTDGSGANENTAAITSVPWTLASGPGLCPAEGKLTKRSSWETEDGTPMFWS